MKKEQLTTKEEGHTQVHSAFKQIPKQHLLHNVANDRAAAINRRHTPRVRPLMLLLFHVIDIRLLLLLIIVLWPCIALMVKDRRKLKRTKNLDRDLAYLTADHHRIQPLNIPFTPRNIQVQIAGAGALAVAPRNEVHQHPVVMTDIKDDGLVELIERDEAVGVAGRVYEADGFAFGENVAGWAAAVV